MGCAKQVEAAVAKLELENVEGCTVDLENNKAVLTTAGPIDAKAVQAAITEAGFPAEYAVTAAPEKEEKAQTEETAATM
jgi:copper chaperone CopZ